VWAGWARSTFAETERPRRKVALKFSPGAFDGGRDAAEPVKTEARSASALNHPNILNGLRDRHGGKPAIHRDGVHRGMTLRALLARGRMNLHNALEIAVQGGLGPSCGTRNRTSYIATSKPENIMLRPDGYAKVLDFGIAKLTSNG